LHVRCTGAERDLWRAKARAARIPLSQYLRDILHDAPTAKRRSPPSVDAKLLQQIAAAGNNLNQIARGVNQSGKLFLPLDLIALQAELVIIERQLAAVLQAYVR
jgi:hypothetical protein